MAKSKQRATLRDVAKNVGVHSSTVSRVLNPKTRDMVSKDVAKHILKTAEDMGYRANTFAKSLKTNQSFTIGVLIPDITNPVFPPIIRGIEKTLGPAGYTTIFADSDNNIESESEILEQMRSRQVDGLILATAHLVDQVVKDCEADGIPFVLINRTVDHKGVKSVTNDDIEGIRLAVEHMVKLGHTRIAHLAGPQNISTGFERHQGFLSSMKAFNLTVDEDLVYFADSFSEEAGRKGMATLLDTGKPFTALITSNDMLAMGCYDEIDDRDLSFPDDISITGYNDMPFVDKFKPALTTVRIPHYAMGEAAANIVLSMIGQLDEPRHSVQQKPELIVRRSTAKAKT